MNRATNIAAWIPPMIGREQALACSMAELARTRLLTLTGPGGTGKSSLALAIAHRLTREGQSPCTPYEDGVWCIDLSTIQEAKLLPIVVYSALDEPGASRKEGACLDTLIEYLGESHVLLLLDNCEHLLPDCTYAVELLLQSCPHIRILATSREALRSPYEQIFPVDPLTVPEMGTELTLEQARGYSAIHLFIERAIRVLPSFQVSPHDVPSIVEICQALDGLPLAIELAAACTRFLSPRQIEERLAQGFTLLTHSYRTATTHHQTLEATMAWSYALLEPSEQKLFRSLAVVAGTFDLELACSMDEESGRTASRNLQALIDKSLVAVVRRDGQSPHYRMLGMLRHFGQSQLAQCGEEAATYQRYCAWISQVARDSLVRLQRSEQAIWFDRLEESLNHIRTVLGWMRDNNLAVPMLNLCSSMVAFWRQRGYLQEGQHWLEMALAAFGAENATAATGHHAEALNALGVLCMWQGDYPRAKTLHKRALAIWRQLGNKTAMALTWFRLGFLEDRCRNYTRARAYLNRSALLYVENGDAHGLDMVRNRLGIIAWNEQRYPEATSLLLESLQAQRNYGHVGSCAATLLNLGALALEQGEFAQGTAYLEESLSLNRHLGDRLAIAHVLAYQGMAAAYQNDWNQSSQWYQEALAVAKALDSAGWMVDPELHFRLIDGIATTLSRRGCVLAAARLWGAMEQLRITYGMRYSTPEHHQYEQEVAHGRASASNESLFLRAWAEGRCLPHQAVMASASEALATLPPSQPESSAEHLTAPVDPGVTTDAFRILGLGPLQMSLGTKRIHTSDFVYAKGQELLYYLLSYPKRTKAQIALALWPDATPEYVQRTFRVVLYHVRRALGGSDWIQREGQFYRFNRRLRYWYDAEAFAALIDSASECRYRAPQQAIESLEAARKLYQGDFWEGLILSDWIVQRQESLRQLHLQAMLLLGDLYLSAEKAQPALGVYQDAVRSDPYCEEANRGAIRCYLALQEPAAAKSQYQNLSRTLWQELGAHPSSQTTSLVESIR